MHRNNHFLSSQCRLDSTGAIVHGTAIALSSTQHQRLTTERLTGAAAQQMQNTADMSKPATNGVTNSPQDRSHSVAAPAQPSPFVSTPARSAHIMAQMHQNLSPQQVRDHITKINRSITNWAAKGIDETNSVLVRNAIEEREALKSLQFNISKIQKEMANARSVISSEEAQVAIHQAKINEQKQLLKTLNSKLQAACEQQTLEVSLQAASEGSVTGTQVAAALQTRSMLGPFLLAMSKIGQLPAEARVLLSGLETALTNDVTGVSVAPAPQQQTAQQPDTKSQATSANSQHFAGIRAQDKTQHYNIGTLQPTPTTFRRDRSFKAQHRSASEGGCRRKRYAYRSRGNTLEALRPFRKSNGHGKSEQHMETEPVNVAASEQPTGTSASADGGGKA